MTTSAIAGIAAPILFAALVVLQAQLQPDYNSVALPISALAAWPYGWIQNLNFYMYGVLVIAHAIGLHRGIRPSPGSAAGPALVGICGLGAIVSGIFPWRLVAGVPTESSGHVVGAILHFMGAAIGAIVLSRRMKYDEAWHGLSAYTLASGIAMLILFAALAGFGIPNDGPLHPWAGLVQRIAVAVWFACLIVLATRLWRVARARTTRV